MLQDESWPLALPNSKLLKLPAALPSSPEDDEDGTEDDRACSRRLRSSSRCFRLKIPNMPTSPKTIAIVPSEGTLCGTSLQSGEAAQSVSVAAHVDP